MNTDEMTMTVSGRIIEVCDEGFVTFKVETDLGTALVWVWEEISINFCQGMDFRIDDASLTFHDGYPIATIKFGTAFWLDGLWYQTHEPPS